MLKQLYCLLLFVSIVYTSNAQNTTVLTNKSIIELKSAGLSKMTIKTMIESSACNFGVDIQNVIALKKQGIDEEIINAMIAKMSNTTPGTVINKSVPDSSQKIISLLQKAGNGIYYYKENEHDIQELEPTVYSQAKQGSSILQGLTYGLAKTKSKMAVSGAKSNFQITAKRPKFYFFFDVERKSLGEQNAGWFSSATSPNEFMLIRFDVNNSKGSREVVSGSFNIAGGSSGVDEGNRKAFKYRKIQPGIYEVYFENDITAGEYCFMYAGTASGNGSVNSKVYDFGIK